MIGRTLQQYLLRDARLYPVLTLTGPRQSGKTTLARATFPQHSYYSLEDPDQRIFALEDPRGFLDQLDGLAHRQGFAHLLLEDVQHRPIFS